MGKAVYTPHLRFQFIEKTSAEVGADKIYSGPITVAQLEELFYRVRDTKLVSGSVRVDGTFENSEDPPVMENGFYEIRATGYSPPSALVEGGDGGGFVDFETPSLSNYFSQRAFSLVEEQLFSSPGMVGFYDYFDSSYSVIFSSYEDGLTVYELNNEIGMWIFGESNYTFGFFMEGAENSLNKTGNVTGFTGSDYVASEDQALVDPFSPGYNISVFRQCATAFSSRLYSGSYDYDDFYGFTSSAYLDGQDLQFVGKVDFELSFSKQVAWVDADGSGNPLSGGNPLYIPVYFSMDTDAGGFAVGSGLMFHFLGESIPSSSVCNLVLSMVNGSVTVPLFVRPLTFLDSVTESGTDIQITATEWWPYSHPDGSPKFNRFTGERI